MDSARFDTLARALTDTRSRRGTAAVLLGGALALLGLTEATAKKRHGKRNKKKRSHRTPAPTCTDGIQNGSETGVDCGGACPRCATGQGCASRNDCAGALCSGGTCQTCTTDPDCGTDADSTCICRQRHPAGGNVCLKDSENGRTFQSCPSWACPAGRICTNDGALGICYKPCGAP